MKTKGNITVIMNYKYNDKEKREDELLRIMIEIAKKTIK